MRNTADVIGGKPITVLLQSILDEDAIHSLVGFYPVPVCPCPVLSRTPHETINHHRWIRINGHDNYNILLSLTIKIKNLSWGQHWSILTIDVSTAQDFYLKEISFIDFPQHGEVFFYGQAFNHRLSINRPTKRGKEKSPSDGHCKCEKEMDDHFYWRFNKFLK
jgi:hypothetical protein